MAVLRSNVIAGSADFIENAAAMRAQLDVVEAAIAAAQAGGGPAAADRHTSRGKMLPRDRVTQLDPHFAAKWSPYAEAFQLRYLARRCVRMGEGPMAWSLMKDALRTCPNIIVREPAKTLTSLVAACVLRFLPRSLNTPLQALIEKG